MDGGVGGVGEEGAAEDADDVADPHGEARRRELLLRPPSPSFALPLRLLLPRSRIRLLDPVRGSAVLFTLTMQDDRQVGQGTAGYGCAARNQIGADTTAPHVGHGTFYFLQ